MANPTPIFRWGTAAPTSTSEYNEAGTVVRNSAPGFGQPIAWLCTVAGRPGTWVVQGVAQGSTISAVTQAGAVPAGTKIMTTSATGNHPLPLAASVAKLTEVIVQSTHSSGSTITAAGADSIVGLATTAQNYAARFISDGVSKWYRAN